MKVWRLAVFVLLATALGRAQALTVAAAADLQFAMQDIASRFQKESGKPVKVIYGSSGNFYQQIENGAPFDMFFSADLGYPRKLEADGLTEPGSLYHYADGRIVLWVRKDSKVGLAAGLRVLLSPAVKKIAIANPQHAPYGQAAVAAMKKQGVYGQAAAKLVLGENVSEAASFVASGAADVGVLPLSLALSPNMKDRGRYAEVPRDDYPAIQQGCAILKSSSQKNTAREFLNFLKTPQIQALLKSYGFEVGGR